MTAAKDFRDKFAIVGLGITKQGRLPDLTPRMLETEAAKLAIEDAGLKPSDIDGAIHCHLIGGSGSVPEWQDSFARILGLPAKFLWFVGRGGAVSASSIVMATQALELGLAKYVVVVIGLDMWSRGHVERRKQGFEVGRGYVVGNRPLYGLDLGDLQPATHHCFLVTRHMHEFGTTSRQLGAIAVAERAWANMNPAAVMYGRPMTIEDHQNSAVFCWPFHWLDICLTQDGGEAFIITTAERAKALKKPPVYIMGVGFGEMMEKLWWEKTNYTQFAVESGKKDAFRLAGIELKDIDFCELYDSMTGEVLIQLEDYGFCKKGDGGPFCASGAIAPGGSLPVNTGGGMLSSHYLLDMTQMGEAIIQLRGEGGARQVKKNEIALVSGYGGEILRPGMCSIHSTVVLRR